MKDLCSLSSLTEGGKCIVRRLSDDVKMRNRLSSLGLIEGTCVTCVMKSFSGDLSAFLIRGAVIALRNKDSEKIMAEPIS